MDLQAHTTYSYHGLTCLMQLGTLTHCYVVDTLALHDHLAALRPALENPRILKLMHGGSSDVRWLQRDFSIYTTHPLDTERFASTLGYPRTGLAYLMSRFCGLHSDKSLSLSDWRLRPLPHACIQHAIRDAVTLPYIAAALLAEAVQFEAYTAAAFSSAGLAQTATLCPMNPFSEVPSGAPTCESVLPEETTADEAAVLTGQLGLEGSMQQSHAAIQPTAASAACKSALSAEAGVLTGRLDLEGSKQQSHAAFQPTVAPVNSAFALPAAWTSGPTLSPLAESFPADSSSARQFADEVVSSGTWSEQCELLDAAWRRSQDVTLLCYTDVLRQAAVQSAVSRVLQRASARVLRREVAAREAAARKEYKNGGTEHCATGGEAQQQTGVQQQADAARKAAARKVYKNGGAEHCAAAAGVEAQQQACVQQQAGVHGAQQQQSSGQGQYGGEAFARCVAALCHWRDAQSRKWDLHLLVLLPGVPPLFFPLALCAHAVSTIYDPAEGGRVAVMLPQNTCSIQWHLPGLTTFSCCQSGERHSGCCQHFTTAFLYKCMPICDDWALRAMGCCQHLTTAFI